MNAKEKRQLENQLMAMGLKDLTDPELIGQLADLVSSSSTWASGSSRIWSRARAPGHRGRQQKGRGKGKGRVAADERERKTPARKPAHGDGPEGSHRYRADRAARGSGLELEHLGIGQLADLVSSTSTWASRTAAKRKRKRKRKSSRR